jgi:dolichyl-diphosphooligosaccharide--protein glycosyltransferase
MAAGLFIRLDNFSYWLENKAIYFSPTDNIPLPQNVDVFYYLDIAKDFLAGDIAKVDLQRQAPSSYERPLSLPLLSLFLALGSKLSGKPLEWVAVFLPPLLGVLLAVPVFFLAFSLFSTSRSASHGGISPHATIGGLAAALFVLLSPIFVERSSIGWCDTDMLNTTLLSSLTLIALRSALARDSRTLAFYLAGYTLLSVFFFLWWDMAPGPVAAFSLSYFLLAAFFNIVLQRKNGAVFVIFILANSLLLFLLLEDKVLSLPGQVLGAIKYTISKDTDGMHFMRAGQLAAEQQDAPFDLMTVKIAGGQVLFFLSLLGLSILGWTARKYFLFLLPWIVLGLLAARSQRLMIFSGVPFSLGMGTLVFFASTFLRKHRAVKLIPLFLAVLLGAWFPYAESQSYFNKAAKRSPLLYDSFRTVGSMIPENSIIWASWGNGHPLVYFTAAKTIGDGIYHPPQLVYSQYFPYAAESPRLAANWITFYATHGLAGIRQTNSQLAGDGSNWSQGLPALQTLLGSGVEESRKRLLGQYGFSPAAAEEFLSFIFPASPPPIYFLLEYVAFGEAWFRWGRMDLNPGSKNKPPLYTMVPIYSFSQSGDRIEGKGKYGEIFFDLAKGRGKLGDTEVRLKQFRFHNSVTPFSHRYDANTWALTLILNQNPDLRLKYGALVNDTILNTVFTRMFFLKEYHPAFFRPVLDESPLVTVYEVIGEGKSSRINKEQNF